MKVKRSIIKSKDSTGEHAMNQKIFFALALGMVLILTSACSGSAKSKAKSESYTVKLVPSDFVEVVDNPYFPLVPGAKWVYEARLKDGTVERNEIEILNETREGM